MAKLGDITLGTQVLSAVESDARFVAKDAQSVSDVEKLGDDYSADELKDLVNRLATILCAMHGKTLAVLLALGLSMFACTAHGGDVSVGTTRFGSLRSPSNVVTSVSVVPRQYALFIIPLNDFHADGSTSSAWSGFELKASTNNFSSMVSEASRLTFWCPSHSIAPSDLGHDAADFFICGGYSTGGDSRTWVRLPDTFSVGQSARRIPNMIACLVSPEKCRGGSAPWLRDDNDSLVWSYIRVTASEHEKGGYGSTSPVWTPIMPVRWYSSRPSWAN